MLDYDVTPTIKLRQPDPQQDAGPLFSLLMGAQLQYQYYLPWVAKIKTVADEKDFLQLAEQQLLQRTALNLVIEVDHEVAGMISCDHFDEHDRSANVGYWLGARFQGRGVMTIAVRGICALGFEQYHRQSLMICAAVDNQASNAVAQRAGFKFSAMRPNGQHLLEGDHDENVYVFRLLDWEK
ncbi:GNAT family N-acetyltransferase [Lactiplantibacillus herbarum]|uniref:GNAT family N-acetyltransferase n=1 Tax=Lactiplantibacillus herbarum TaxID=1670446 RepID=UPI00064ED20E|nr:GNAT family N-acetyltransferase [Lactiplantibacillus herbarum]